MKVVKLMNGVAGRSARVLAGLALVAVTSPAGGTGGLVLVSSRWWRVRARPAAPLLRARCGAADAADDLAGQRPGADAAAVTEGTMPLARAGRRRPGGRRWCVAHPTTRPSGC